MFFYVFFTFFKIQKNVTFYVFLPCFIRFLELCWWHIIMGGQICWCFIVYGRCLDIAVYRTDPKQSINQWLSVLHHNLTDHRQLSKRQQCRLQCTHTRVHVVTELAIRKCRKQGINENVKYSQIITINHRMKKW